MEQLRIHCERCLLPFDTDEREPHIIPNCYDTICLQCMKSLIKPEQKSFKCPICSQEFNSEVMSLSKFPKNVAILRGIENSKNEKNSCRTHNKHLEMFCRTCNIKVCIKCIIDGKHDDHAYETFENILRDVHDQLQEVEEYVKRVDIYHTTIQRIMDLREMDLKNLVEAKAQIMIKEINSRKQTLFVEIEEIFKKLRTDCFIVKSSESSNFDLLDWKAKSEQILKQIDLGEDLTEINLTLRSFNLRSYLPIILDWLQNSELDIAKKQLAQIKISFEAGLIENLRDFCRIELQKLVESPKNQEFTFDCCEIKDKELTKLIKSNIVNQFDIHKELLPVENTPNKRKISPNRSLANQFALYFEYKKPFNFSTIPLNFASIMLWNFHDSKIIKLNFQKLNLNDEVLFSFAIGLYYLSGLNHFELDISKSTDPSRFLQFIGDSLASMVRLKTLKMNFSSIDVLEFDVVRLSRSLSSMFMLTNFEINLSNNQKLSSSSFIALFQRVGQLKSLKMFALDAEKCPNFDGEAFYALNEMLNFKSNSSIKRISLNFGDQSSDYKGFNHILEMKGQISFDIQLAFEGDDLINDTILENFGNSLTGKSEDISNLSLKFRNCKNISDVGLEYLLEMIRKNVNLVSFALEVTDCENISLNSVKWISNLLKSSPRLQNLCISLDRDGCLELLLPGLVSLKDLSKLCINVVDLRMSKEDVVDFGNCLESFEKLSELKLSIKGNFKFCEILPEIAQNNLKKLDLMKSLEIQSYDENSEILMKQMKEILPNINMLVFNPIYSN